MAYDFFKATEKEFNKIYRIMEENFPESELRSRVKMYELLTQQDNYHIYCVGSVGRHERQVMGVVIIWELDDIVFFENFAVEKHMRGKGLAGLLFDLVLEKTTKPVIIEVKPPEEFYHKRVISFYKRHKMVFNNYDYLMPPIKQGDEFLPLKLMSYPNPIPTISDFEKVTDCIYRDVYNFINGERVRIVF